MLIIFIFLGIGFLIFKFMIPQAMFIPGLTIQTKTTTWKGIDVELKSTYFGSITSGPVTGDICADNDGHITLSNSYSTGEKFSLLSSQTGSDPCNSQNGIEARMTIPAGGKIIGYSDNVGNSPIGRGSQIASRSKVTIMSGLTTLFNDDLNIPARLGLRQSSKTFELTFDNPTEIIVSVSTWGPGGGGSSSAKIFFELVEKPTPPEPTPPTEYCGDGICQYPESQSDCLIDCGTIPPEPECTINSDCQTGHQCVNQECELIPPGNGNGDNGNGDEEPDHTLLYTWIAGIFLGIVIFIFITVLIIRRRR